MGIGHYCLPLCQQHQRRMMIFADCVDCLKLRLYYLLCTIYACRATLTVVLNKAVIIFKQKFYCNLHYDCLTSYISFFCMAKSYTLFFVTIFQKQAFCLYFLHFSLMFKNLLQQKFSIYSSFVF